MGEAIQTQGKDVASTQLAEIKKAPLGFKPKKVRPRPKAGHHAGPYRVDRKFYTSGQAARLLNIPDRTLRRYLSTGKIDGIQHPITGTWQIEKDALAAFIQKCGCSVILEANPTHVLVIHDNRELVLTIKTSISEAFPDAEVEAAYDPCNALIQIGEDCPDIVILKADIPGIPSRDILSAIKNNVTTAGIKIIALEDDPEKRAELEKLGADASISPDCASQNMSQVVESLLAPESN